MSDLHEDFRDEISLLHDGRPTLSPSELDGVKRRARLGGPARGGGAWQRFARTRGAVVAALAAGVLMSTGGTALGVSGLDSSGTASSAQYGTTGGGTTGGGTTGSGLGGTTGSGGGTTTGSTPSQAVSPSEEAEQPAVTTSGQLPFTGFLAIPILILGLVLLSVGLLGRRLARRTGATRPS